MFEQLKANLAREFEALKAEATGIEHAVESAYEHSTIHFVVSGLWNAAGTVAERLQAIYKAGYRQAQLDAEHRAEAAAIHPAPQQDGSDGSLPAK